MKYTLAPGLCAAALVFSAAALPGVALAEDVLHEDGTWGPRVDDASEPAPRAEPPRRHRHGKGRRKLPPVEVDPQPATSDPADPEEPSVKDDGDRLRFRGGVGLDIGAYVMDGSGLALAGIEGRLGIQFNDFFALYATPSFWLGVGEWDLMGRVALGVVPEITLGDVFFVGAGPELYAAGAASDDHVLGDPLNIGVRTRAGFAFGHKRPGRRHAFTLAFDSRVDFYEEGVGVAPTIGLGYDAF